MDVDRIRSFYYQRPVQPFVIRTASGESYTIRHPELMAIDEEHGVVLLLWGGSGMAMIDIASITEITRDFTKQESGTGT